MQSAQPRRSYGKKRIEQSRLACKISHQSFTHVPCRDLPLRPPRIIIIIIIIEIIKINGNFIDNKAIYNIFRLKNFSVKALFTILFDKKRTLNFD